MRTANPMRLTFYFVLVGIVFILFLLQAFNLVYVNTDKFTYYVLGILVVVLALPLVDRIKVFDVIEVSRPKIMLFKEYIIK